MSNEFGQGSELITLGVSQKQSAEGLSDIFKAVSALLERQGAQFSQTERKMAAEILQRISKDVEMSLRIALAEKLADRADAPPELILLLADDRIEVARPVLMRSPVLTEADLLRILSLMGDGHYLAVAQRASLGEAVTAALARSDCEAVLVALLRNEGAKISGETFQSLAVRARALEYLRGPLIGRNDLPGQLAVDMYTWVSVALKKALSTRYPQIANSLANALDESVSAHKAGKAPTSSDSAKKLVDKLNAAGQLKASFLVRSLQQGQMELFEQGFAALLTLDVDATRNLLYRGGSSTVALACRAAGIDRTVFPTMFHLSRHYNNVATTLTEDDSAAVNEIFQKVPKTEALSMIRAQAA